MKRQSTTLYLGSGSSFSGPNCSPAHSFTLSDGQLSAHGHFVSANADTKWEPFKTKFVAGTITTTFSLENGTLYWSHTSFIGGTALFCKYSSGEIEILFAGATDVSDESYPNYPSDCQPVMLQAMSGMSSSSSFTVCTNIF
jgi:hypothetical protein